MICHYWFWSHGFEFQDSACNGCHDLTILRANASNKTVKNLGYRCITQNISKSKAINLLKYFILEYRGYIWKQHCLKVQCIKASFF